MIEYMLNWCNSVNPQTEKEMTIIRYGAELLLENFFRLLVLYIIGCLIGKGYETIIILVVFCSIRSQAGGIHAGTGWGCGLCMLVVWGVALIVGSMLPVSLTALVLVYLSAVGIILLTVPKTINRTCYTSEMVIKKKKNSLLLLSFFVAMACVNGDIRNYIICAVTLEVATLLPKI